MGKWVDVNDRLPLEGQIVLSASSNKGRWRYFVTVYTTRRGRPEFDLINDVGAIVDMPTEVWTEIHEPVGLKGKLDG